jgi:hypothetical protein
VLLLSLKQQHQIFELRRKEFEDAEADLAQRIRDVKDLIPFAKELEEIGLDFTLANSWVSVIKTYASKKMVYERTAAWQLANDLSSWLELEGFETAIKNAKHQLELLGMAQEDRKEEIAYFADLRKAGICKREVMELMDMVNSKVNGNGFKLDKEINLPIEEIDD